MGECKAACAVTTSIRSKEIYLGRREPGPGRQSLLVSGPESVAATDRPVAVARSVRSLAEEEEDCRSLSRSDRRGIRSVGMLN